MREITIHEAKTHLSRLLKSVEAGETWIIKRGDVPVAQLGPLPAKPAGQRVWGQDEGKIWIAADFDAPMPPEFMQHFSP